LSIYCFCLSQTKTKITYSQPKQTQTNYKIKNKIKRSITTKKKNCAQPKKKKLFF